MKPEPKRLDLDDAEHPALLQELVAFAQTHDRKGACFQGWTTETLAGYLIWHASQGTLVFVRSEHATRNTQPAIEGLAIGWQLDESELEPWKAGGNAQHAFHWQPTNPLGDSFLVAEVMCSARRAFGPLIAEYQWRYPNWRALKTFTFRRGKLVRYQPARIIQRLEAYAL